MVETEKKKSPFMPSNYVSILQLQQRWMKEKQKEQEEKEEQKRREEEEEEKQRRREEEEEKKEKLIREEQDDRKKYKKQGGGEKCEEQPNPDTVAVRPPRRYRTPYNRRKPVASRSKPKPKPEEEEEVNAVAAAEVEVNAGTVVVEAGGGEDVRDEERKADDDSKKKKKDRWRKKKNNKKSKKVEDVTGDMEPPATDMDIVEKKESIPARRNIERKGKRSEWWSKGEFAAAASGKVWEAKDDATVEIGVKMEEVEQKFGDLSVKREGEGRARLRFVRNGGGGGGGGGRDMASGRFGGGWERGRRTPGDGSLVWVKKEEV